MRPPDRQVMMARNAPPSSGRAKPEGRQATRPPARRVPVRLSEELLGEIAAITQDTGCELYHAEWKGGTLRLYLDRTEGETGVQLADCEKVSKQVSALLDVVDFGAGRYTLEVSSPGLDRELHRPADYRRFVGHLTKVTFREAPGGAKKTVVARLTAFDEADDQPPRLRLELGGKTPTELLLPLNQVETARLEIEL